MVNEKVVLDTIKKMKKSGLDESVIKSTLLDIGLSEQEAESFLVKMNSSTESDKPKLESEPNQEPVPDETGKLEMVNEEEPANESTVLPNKLSSTSIVR